MTHSNTTRGGIVLRDYQIEALAAIDREHAAHRSTLLVLATGLGKTTVFAEHIARRHVDGGLALVVAHREELVQQAARVLEQTGLRVGVEMAEQRDGTSLQMPLSGRGLPDVVVASVQTLSRRSRLAKFDCARVHTVVVDEAHHATASTYVRVLDAMPLAKVLGVTATPDRADKIGLRDLFETCAYRLELRDGIARGWLAPIRAEAVVCADLDLSQVRSRCGDLDEHELQLAIGRDAVLHQIAGPLAQRSEGRPTIVFVPGVQVARDLAEMLTAYGMPARSVDGETDRDVRRETIAAYARGELRALVNCGVFVEGFDSPRTSCIAIARPTSSRSLYAQMIGRGTRTAPGKNDLLVLDFVGAVGRHSLVGPLDVLGGEPLPDRVRELAAAALAEGADVVQAERRARETVDAEELRANLAEQDALRAARGRVSFDVQSVVRVLDPFGDAGLLVNDDGPRATDEQLRRLAKQGVAAGDLSFAQASGVLQRLDQRVNSNLCSWKQARTLARAGCNPELDKRAAGYVVGILANNRWRRPSTWTRDERGFYGPPEVHRGY